MDTIVKRKYPVKRDKEDKRDFICESFLTQLPQSIDLRDKFPFPAYDQGETNSCVANAVSGAVEFLNPTYEPSRDFIYWNARYIDGDDNVDGGTTIRSGVKAVVSYGVCPESLFPFNNSDLFTEPPSICYLKANKDLVTQYTRLLNLQNIKESLSLGFPVVFGMSVWSSFESPEVAKTGIVPIPNMQTEQFLGGHGVLIVGYNDVTSYLIVRNSWGPQWGINGYFMLPYEFIINPQLSQDYWSIRKLK